jgi:hypothetical protein
VGFSCAGAERGIAKRSQFADKLLLAARDQSFDRLNQRARLSQQVLQLPSLLNGFARKPAMLQRVFVAAWAPESSALPCIRQGLFPLTAGDMQGLPERVFALQRRLDSIGPVLRG